MNNEGLGYGKRRLIAEIVKQNWAVQKPEDKKIFSYNELLFVVQEMLEQEGKSYLDGTQSINFGYEVFRRFVQLLLYRNLANYDSMVLMTSEKGCITGDALLEMPRDLLKYPKGIPLEELEGKGPQYVYSFNNITKKLELKQCDGIEFVKEADVWEVELNNGMKIQATEDHPFLQIDGTYKQLKELIYNKKSGKIYNKKQKKIINTDRLRIFSRPYIYDENDNRIKVDFSSIDRKNNDTPLKHSMIEHRFIIEQLLNKKLCSDDIVHHKNNLHHDNNVLNLEICSRIEHMKTHNMKNYYFKEKNKYILLRDFSIPIKRHNKINTVEYNIECKEKRIFFCSENKNFIKDISKKREQNNINSNHIAKGGIITNISFIGKKKVYDVVNVKDNHNFIVNNFVVSNTGKSSAAIMLAREWCRLLGIKFDPDRHIAYNNSDVMSKIDKLNKFEPLICVPGNTYVRIKKNNIEYNELIKKLVNKNNFEVLTYNINNDNYEWKIPEKVILTKQSIIDTIELENGIKIQATSNHLFLTKEGKYKTVNELTTDDELVISTKKCVYCNKEFYNHFKYCNTCSEECRKKYNRYIKPYRLTHPEKSKLHDKKAHKHKMKNNIIYHINHNLFTRLRNTPQKIKLSNQKIRDGLGCTTEFLKQHLEKQFNKKMSWKNYGKYWSIDHIVPISKFNLTNDNEFKKCFHYTNIQPLEISLNAAKGRWYNVDK